MVAVVVNAGNPREQEPLEGGKDREGADGGNEKGERDLRRRAMAGSTTAPWAINYACYEISHKNAVTH